MQQATGRRERKNAKVVAIVCAALILLTLVISGLKPWSRKPADAGECATHDAEWRQNALMNKINATDDPMLRNKSVQVQAGSHWDDKNHLWIVPFRTTDQSADTNNFVALVHCTGSVDINHD
jgi:hypothetical protein